jgi:hypothetical protein
VGSMGRYLLLDVVGYVVDVVVVVAVFGEGEF